MLHRRCRLMTGVFLLTSHHPKDSCLMITRESPTMDSCYIHSHVRRRQGDGDGDGEGDGNTATAVTTTGVVGGRPIVVIVVV